MQRNCTLDIIKKPMQKTAKQILKEAQEEVLQIVTKNRISLLQSLEEAEEIHAVENYENGLLGVLSGFPKGRTLLQLHEVFTDTSELKKTRDKLKAAGKIMEDSEGTTVRLEIVRSTQEAPGAIPDGFVPVVAPDRKSVV